MRDLSAGWYADPDDPGRIRYWDGIEWTRHTALAPPPGSPYGPPPSSPTPPPWGVAPVPTHRPPTIMRRSVRQQWLVGSGGFTKLATVIGGLLIIGSLFWLLR